VLVSFETVFFHPRHFTLKMEAARTSETALHGASPVRPRLERRCFMCTCDGL